MADQRGRNEGDAPPCTGIQHFLPVKNTASHWQIVATRSDFYKVKMHKVFGDRAGPQGGAYSDPQTS